MQGLTLAVSWLKTMPYCKQSENPTLPGQPYSSTLIAM